MSKSNVKREIVAVFSDEVFSGNTVRARKGRNDNAGWFGGGGGRFDDRFVIGSVSVPDNMSADLALVLYARYLQHMGIRPQCECAKLVDDCYAVNKKLHNQFAESHSFRNWFRRDYAIIEALKEYPGQEIKLNEKLLDQLGDLDGEDRMKYCEDYIFYFVGANSAFYRELMEQEDPGHTEYVENDWRRLEAEIETHTEAA